MTRLEKKERKLYENIRLFCDWLQDLRGGLLETLEENNDTRVIIKQFKHRMIKRGNRNSLFKRSKLDHYVKVALDLDR